MERWREIYKKHPKLYQYALKIEENNKYFGRQSLAPKGYTLRELENMIKQKQELPIIKTDSPCGSECMI